MFEIYRLYQQHDVSPQAQLHYMIGCVMDAHIRLGTNNQSLTSDQIYRQKLAPEQTNITDIWCQDRFLNASNLAEVVWDSKLGNTVSETRAKQIITAADEKLLKKGLPNPSSIRFIADQLKTHYMSNDQTIVIPLTLCFLLGGYKHCTYIASPLIRLAAYKHSRNAERMYEWVFSTLNSRELYSMISEFIVAITKTNSALEHVLSHITPWDIYSVQSTTVCDAYIRKKVHVLVDNSIPCPESFQGLSRKLFIQNKIGQLFDVNAPLTAQFMSMAFRVFNVKYRIPASVIKNVGGQEKAREIYKIAIDNMMLGRLNRAVLHKMGVPRFECNRIGEILNMYNVKYTKRMTKLYSQLSNKAKAIIYLYLHSIMQKNRLQYMSLQRPATQRCEGSVVLCCLSCYTYRSKAKGMGKKNSTTGIHIDLTKYGVECASCHSKDIHKIDMSLGVIRVPTTGDKTDMTISMCSRCNNPFVLKNRFCIGADLYCKECYKKTLSALVPTHCFCGKELDGKLEKHALKKPKSILAYNRVGQLSTYGVCSNHASVLPSKELLNIELLKFINNVE